MQNVTLNTTQAGYSTGGVFTKTQDTGGLFATLLARLGQANSGTGVQPAATSAAATAAASSTTSQGGNITSTLETPLTPIQRLQAGLEETGRDLGDFQVAAEDRDTLEEVLVLSGYSAEQAAEIVDRASLEDGSVNLGAVFAVLDQYTPEGGVVLALSGADLPLLAQVLKELGLPQDEVHQFLNSQPRDGDTVLVSGLEKLLAQAQALAEARGEAPEVDASLVRDLLSKLGLSNGDISLLMARAGDGSGRLSPEEALALLQNAALTQDQAVKGALTELAQRLRVNGDGGLEAEDDAERLRQQVMIALERREVATRQGSTGSSGVIGEATQSAPGTNGTTPNTAAQAAAAAAAATGGTAVESGEGQQAQTSQSSASTLAEVLQTAVKEAGQKSEETTPEQVIRAAKASADGQAVESVKSASSGKEGAGGQAEGQAGGNAGHNTGGNTAQTAGLANGATASGGETANTAATLVALDGVAQTAGAGAAKASGSVLPGLVVRQVAEQMALMAKNGQSQLRLNLRPPELGGVNLKLSMEGGALKATLTAESSAAKAALESGLDQLKAQLAQQGIRTERLDVALSPDAERREASAGGQGQADGGNASGGSSGSGQGGDSEADNAALGAAQAGASGGSSRINLFA